MMLFYTQRSGGGDGGGVDRASGGVRDDPSTGLIPLTGSPGVDTMLAHLRFALHNVFLLVVVAGALTLLINLFSWAVGGAPQVSTEEARELYEAQRAEICSLSLPPARELREAHKEMWIR